jgi:predicted Zn-dependent peptidase
MTTFSLTGGLEERMGVPALRIFVVNNNTVMASRCQKAILSEIDRLRGSLVSAEELAKAKNLFKMDYLLKLSTDIDRALLLTDAAFSNVPLDLLASDLDNYFRVTPQQLFTLVNRHFGSKNRVILNLGTK